ncbi:hypothetical protein GGF46_000686 [Coemansia sp. RSA 552]|nr:hypothetical protein GGF46_000686 [Coemansia sp. RSA 552]
MTTSAAAQLTSLVDITTACRVVSEARSCVLLVGPGVSRRLGLEGIRSDPDIQAATAHEQQRYAAAGNGPGTNVMAVDSGGDARGAISSFCGRIAKAQGSHLGRLVASLAATPKLVRVFTDDTHTAALVPSDLDGDQVLALESRIVCIHGHVTELVCTACTAKSQLTQAVIFRAACDKPLTCDVCGNQGNLAVDGGGLESEFVPDIYRSAHNEQRALDVARSDSKAGPDVLVVVGADGGVSDTWAEIAAVLSRAAARTVIVGHAESMPHGITALERTMAARGHEDTFAREYLEIDARGVVEVPAIDVVLVDTSSAADSSDDRAHMYGHMTPALNDSSGGDGPRKQQNGAKRVKSRNREKTNLNHLLNFSLPERAPPPLPPVRLSRRRAMAAPVSERQAAINRSLFINANFRFVLKPRFWTTFMPVVERPDMQLRPEWIERVIMPVATETVSCPICLSPPTAARVTKCGHVFCLACILRHITYSGAKQQGTTACPICWCEISSDSLLPVHFWEAQYDTKASAGARAKAGSSTKPPASTHITVRLMQRLRGTTFCLPRSSRSRVFTAAAIDQFKKADGGSACLDSSRVPWTFSDGALAFARFMLASHEYSTAEYESELRHLQANKDDEGADAEARLFIESAIMTVEAALADARAPGSAEAALESTVIAEQAPLDEATASGGDGLKPDDFLYFYQADDGQHIYMHPLHMRTIAQDRGGYTGVPDEMDVKVRHMVESIVTDEVRQRFRFLDHLPLRCEIVVVEPELKPLVSHQNFARVRSQLAHKDKQHAARARHAVLEEAHSRAAALHAGRMYHGGADGMPLQGNAEPDTSSFPALGEHLPPTEHSESSRAEPAARPCSPGTMWPRQAVPADPAYNALWAEFEQAAASQGHRKSLSFDSEHDPYEDYSEDFSIQAKSPAPATTGRANGNANGNAGGGPGKRSSSKRKGAKKGVTLVLSGTSTRRSR